MDGSLMQTTRDRLFSVFHNLEIYDNDLDIE
jgi:hypothetical protein